MKYNEELFNISELLGVNTNEKNINANDINKWNKLLKFLLKRFAEELISEHDNTGIIKTKFRCPFLQELDDGYDLIDELVNSNKFDSLAREYCFYLGDVEYRCDEWHDAYYEIIWDYKTYFEVMDKYKGVYGYNEEIKKCLQGNHQFGKWETETWNIQEVISRTENGVTTRPKKNIRWLRICTRCGCFEVVDKEPKELVEAREKRLSRLKNKE